MEIPEDVVNNWKYFKTLSSGKYKMEEETVLPPDINFNLWYDMAVGGLPVAWSEIHHTAEYFGPVNDKWLLDVYVNDKDENIRINLYRKIGRMIRMLGGNRPYIKNDIKFFVYGNFFLYCDPAYDKKNENDIYIYTTRLTDKEKEEIINKTEIMDLITGIMNSAYVGSSLVGLFNISEEIFWDHVDWRDLHGDFRSHPVILACLTTMAHLNSLTDGHYIDRSSVVDVLSGKTEEFKYEEYKGKLTNYDIYGSFDDPIFWQEAIINYMYTKGYTNGLVTRPLLLSGVEFPDLKLYNVPSGDRLYGIVLKSILLHSDEDLMLAMAKLTGLLFLIKLKFRPMLDISDQDITKIGRLIVTHGTIQESVKYGMSTVGSDAMYAIANFIQKFIARYKVENELELLEFIEYVGEQIPTSPKHLPYK